MPRGNSLRPAKPLLLNDIGRWVFRCAVVMPPPAFDDDPRFLQCEENLVVEQLVAKLRVHRRNRQILQAEHHMTNSRSLQVASGFAILTMIVCTTAFAYPGEKYATHDNLSMHKTIGIALNARPGKVVSKELE